MAGDAAVFSGAELRFPTRNSGGKSNTGNGNGNGNGNDAVRNTAAVGDDGNDADTKDVVVQPECGKVVAYTTGPENAYRITPIEGDGAMFAITLYLTSATLHDADSAVKSGVGGHTAISEGSRDAEADDKSALFKRPADESRPPTDEL